MGITLRDILNIRKEVMRQNRTPESICLVITRKTAIHIFNDLYNRGLTEKSFIGMLTEITNFNEDKICEHMHNSILFGVMIKVKGES